jgi:hypothetical protein
MIKSIVGAVLLFFIWLSLPIMEALSADLPFDYGFEFCCALAFVPVLILFITWKPEA